jgi:RHS repeat-associated protein
MEERIYSDSTTDTFAYDKASRLTSAFKDRHDITVNRAYFPDGTMRSESYVLDNRTYTLERTYDERNLVDTQTFADGKVMSWDHDARGIVTDVRYDGEHVLEQRHDVGYRLTKQTFGNDLVRDITYDRLDNMRGADIVKNGTITIPELNFTYQYLADKNVEKETQTSGTFEDLSFTATYDPGNRVTSYNRADGYPGARENQSWNYDGAGNWNSTVIDGTSQSRTHSDSDQLEVIAGDNLTYDPRGNQLTDNRSNEYTWDLDNRIIEADGSGYSNIEYRYDALGRRIVREQGTSKEVLLWWNNTEQSEHKHQAGQTTIQNDLQANPSEEALNTIFARALEGDKLDIQYYHKNYLDHVMAVSDDNGNMLEHYRYTAFGEPEIYSPTGTKLADTAIDNDILWNVRRYEPSTNLYLYKYRDYDAVSGRWPSRDPIEEAGGLNLYGFVGNDVLRLWDYLGNAVMVGDNGQINSTAESKGDIRVYPDHLRLADKFNGFGVQKADYEFSYHFHMRYSAPQNTIVLAHLIYNLEYKKNDGTIKRESQSYYEWFLVKDYGGAWGLDTQTINIPDVCEGNLTAYITYGKTTSFNTSDNFGAANINEWTLSGDVFSSWGIRKKFYQYEHYENAVLDDLSASKSWSFTYEFNKVKDIDHISITY